jgi:hypothetical protein
MSDKDRRKKDGRDTNKDRQAMREDVKERHEKASEEPRELQRTEERIMNYKPGTGSDRNTQGRAT